VHLLDGGSWYTVGLMGMMYVFLFCQGWKIQGMETKAMTNLYM
jgi:hypothetical protein